MTIDNDVLTLMLFLAACAGLVGFMLAFSAILGPKKTSAVKNEPFECGVTDVAPYSGNFSVKFYLIALLFLLFDIEIAFLFPWATIFKSLGLFGFIEMFIFLAVVVSGLVYAWKKGALEWD